MSSHDHPSDGVTFTDSGAAKMREVLAAVPGAQETAGLRIDIFSGGCSSFRYRLALEEPGEDDLVFEDRGVRVLVAPEHLRYVHGAEVDYREDENGAGFHVLNPHVVRGCNCGSSFILREESEPEPAAA